MSISHIVGTGQTVAILFDVSKKHLDISQLKYMSIPE